MSTNTKAKIDGPPVEQWQEADAKEKAIPIERWMEKRNDEEIAALNKERESKIAQYPNLKRLLVDLLNLPQFSPTKKLYVSAQAIGEFERLYKNVDLRHGCSVLSYAFRRAWEQFNQSKRTGEINLLVGGILNETIEGRPTALRLNIIGGWKIEPQARDLLDLVALEFFNKYRSVSRCKREGCNKLFIPDYPNAKYCARPCTDAVRSNGRREWMRNMRAVQKKAAPKAKSRRKS